MIINIVHSRYTSGDILLVKFLRGSYNVATKMKGVFAC